MSQEKYKPTPEDIKSAEENMTPEQAEMSGERLIKLKDMLKDLLKQRNEIVQEIDDIEETFKAMSLLINIGRASQSTDSTIKFWKDRKKRLIEAYDIIEYSVIKPIEDSINQLGEYGK